MKGHASHPAHQDNIVKNITIIDDVVNAIFVSNIFNVMNNIKNIKTSNPPTKNPLLAMFIWLIKFVGVSVSFINAVKLYAIFYTSVFVTIFSITNIKITITIVVIAT